jgi:hypothetical protein
VKASNSCAVTLIFGSFFFIVFCQSFFSFFPPLFCFFFLSVLLSFLLLSNWFLFLSSFVFPLLFRYCFIPVSLAHVVSSLVYPNLLGTKRLGCCCCCSPHFHMIYIFTRIDRGNISDFVQVASFGAYLMDRNILTMSLAPRDSHKAQVQFALERGVPAVIGVLGTIKLPYPSRSFDMVHCSRCLIPWGSNGM